MFRILLVCTGNTCRSPMAEFLLKTRAERDRLDHKIRVLSAGLAAGRGKASREAIKVMQNRSIDLTSHEARQVLPEYIDAADIILTMTNNHKSLILSLFPQAEGKVHTLCEFAGMEGEVCDPFGGDDSVYETCARQLTELVERSWRKIVMLAGDSEKVEKK